MQPQYGHSPPDQLALDDRQRQAAALQPARDRFAGDPAAETHDVKFLWQPLHLQRRSRAATIPAATWP